MNRIASWSSASVQRESFSRREVEKSVGLIPLIPLKKGDFRAIYPQVNLLTIPVLPFSRGAGGINLGRYFSNGLKTATGLIIERPVNGFQQAIALSLPAKLILKSLHGCPLG